MGFGAQTPEIPPFPSTGAARFDTLHPLSLPLSFHPSPEVLSVPPSHPGLPAARPRATPRTPSPSMEPHRAQECPLQTPPPSTELCSALGCPPGPLQSSAAPWYCPKPPSTELCSLGVPPRTPKTQHRAPKTPPRPLPRAPQGPGAPQIPPVQSSTASRCSPRSPPPAQSPTGARSAPQNPHGRALGCPPSPPPPARSSAAPVTIAPWWPRPARRRQQPGGFGGHRGGFGHCPGFFPGPQGTLLPLPAQFARLEGN